MYKNKSVGVIIPAAGEGKRMGGTQAKQFIEIEQKPLLVHTIEQFQHAPEVDCIVLVASNNMLGILSEIVSKYRLSKVVDVVCGGKERQDSVWNGLQRLKESNVDLVLVHDSVRPFVVKRMITDVCDAALRFGAAAPGIEPKDTIKTVDEKGKVLSTLKRNDLRVIQTPQAFQFPVLFEAFERAITDNFYATDDTGLVERNGGHVQIVPGSYENIKITTPEDLEFARLRMKTWY
jgi:2-C-methyl-D-erythritol 4-phosphate cytidylyltransferase